MFRFRWTITIKITIYMKQILIPLKSFLKKVALLSVIVSTGLLLTGCGRTLSGTPEEICAQKAVQAGDTWLVDHGYQDGGKDGWRDSEGNWPTSEIETTQEKYMTEVNQACLKELD